jgi:hypothetical protein
VPQRSMVVGIVSLADKKVPRSGPISLDNFLTARVKLHTRNPLRFQESC